MEDRPLPSALKNAAFAVRTFLDSEPELFSIDINERSISARLAFHLQRRFPKCHVDCEYNRLGDAIKRLPVPQDTRTNDLQGRAIFPDIIVHRRGTKDNLLIIEIKKSNNRDIHNDVEKLKSLTEFNGKYAYRFGIHIVFNCDTIDVDHANIYISGNVCVATSQNFFNLIKSRK